MSEKLLKAIEFLFYLLVLLYLVGKSFEIITVLIDILFLIYCFKNKDKAILFYKKYQEVFIAFAILLGYFTLQSLITNDIIVSLKHSLGMIRFIILFFAVLFVFNTKSKIINLILVSFLALFIVNIDSLYQYIFKVDFFGKEMYLGRRLTAWTDMPVVSLYSGQFFGLVFASLFLLKGKYRKIAIFSFILFIMIFFLSGNRSPVVALFSTIFIVGLFSIYKKYFLYIFLGISIIFSLSLFNEKLYNGYSGILNPTSNLAISGRKQVYNTSFEMIKENPLIGFGGGMYRYEFQKYYSKIYDKNSKDIYEKYWLDISPYHAHNILLDVLVSWGLLGLILIVWVAYQIYKKFVKNRPLTLIASIGVIYCITPLQFAKSLSQSNWQFYTFLGLIFLALISVYETIEIEDNSRNLDENSSSIT